MRRHLVIIRFHLIISLAQLSFPKITKMTDAGFFRGTTADQDNRFANKQKKLLKELNFSPILNTKLNMSKIDVDSLKPWIEQKIKDVLEKDDEILSESIFEHLAEKEPDGKSILLLITGFVDDNKASKFLEELWTKLIDLQDSSNGINKSENDNHDSEIKSKENDAGDEVKQPETNLDESINKSNSDDDHTKNKDSQNKRQSSSSSHSDTPPSRSVSKSPGNRKLDELSRGRPRRRLQDEVSRDGSNQSPEHEDKKVRSRSHSGSVTSKLNAGEEGPRHRSVSRSSSRSKRSGSRSRSYSRSASRQRSSSRSGSRSRTRSPRDRSRSPFGHSFRGRRSRSRSKGYRPRSRSPRGRRGFGPSRGPYRGSFGYQDRRRGAIAPFRRRSPWGRRRFSPRSPPRRRRSPSFSPRRRRSPSPYSRRSRSRSPPGHMLHRNMISPRLHGGPSHLDMMGGRHGIHHDMHRPMLQSTRSPRGAIDYRVYGDSHALSRRSPGHIMNKLPDLPTSSHVSLAGPLGPPAPGPYSPPSSRKKHKKEKKHRKHKKSKKHRSASPEKKKKHKKHKKTKKSHKSH